MKIMAIVDRHGLPLSVSTHAANHHEVRLVQLCFDFYRPSVACLYPKQEGLLTVRFAAQCYDRNAVIGCASKVHACRLMA